MPIFNLYFSKAGQSGRKFLGIVLLLTLAAWIPGAWAVVFKVAAISPDGSMWMRMLREGGSEIAQRTDGRVEFKFYPGGVMGDDKAVLRKIRSRQLHGAVITAGGLNQIYSDFELYSLPMVFNDLDEVDHIRQAMDEDLLGGLRENGFVGFGIVEVGFAYAMSKSKVETFDEVRAQKVWIPDGDPSSELAIRTFGISPIPLSIADVLGGLQTGLINGVAVPPVAAIALQWHTQLKYVFDLPLMYVYGVLTVNRQRFESLDEADQQIVMEVMGEVVRKVDAQNRIDHERAAEVLQIQGLDWIVPSAAEVDRWRQLAEKASAELVNEGSISLALFESLQDRLSAYRGTLD